tara:strand:- start:120 stop:515 length:396 start_codon:yes stop_codon:yes gene_type:complete
MKKILTLLLLLPTTAYAELSDWSKKDQALFNSFIVLNTIDTMQTWDMIDCQKRNYKCPLKERNVILGPTPSKVDVLMLKIGTGYAMYHILDNIDEKKHPRVRTITLGIVNAMYIKTVHNNYEAGLRFGFAF